MNYFRVLKEGRSLVYSLSKKPLNLKGLTLLHYMHCSCLFRCFLWLLLSLGIVGPRPGAAQTKRWIKLAEASTTEEFMKQTQPERYGLAVSQLDLFTTWRQNERLAHRPRQNLAGLQRPRPAATPCPTALARPSARQDCRWGAG